MAKSSPASPKASAEAHQASIACVAYLNAKPLIQDPQNHLGMAGGGKGAEVVFDVPAAIADRLRSGSVTMGLVPVVDLLDHPTSLHGWPVGGIACEGSTLTVRLFSRCPVQDIRSIAVDGHSHTSVILASVVLHHLAGRIPQRHPVDWLSQTPAEVIDQCDALLLIGDKVISQSPPAWVWPYQVDLGQAWQDWTGLPFVFAIWASHADRDPGDLPRRLDAIRRDNHALRAAIAEQHAPDHDWPVTLAVEYLSNVLRYEIGPREIQGLLRFAYEACKLNLVNAEKPVLCTLDGGA